MLFITTTFYGLTYNSISKTDNTNNLPRCSCYLSIVRYTTVLVHLTNVKEMCIVFTYTLRDVTYCA